MVSNPAGLERTSPQAKRASRDGQRDLQRLVDHPASQNLRTLNFNNRRVSHGTDHEVDDLLGGPEGTSGSTLVACPATDPAQRSSPRRVMRSWLSRRQTPLATMATDVGLYLGNPCTRAHETAFKRVPAA
jgi:hypothetical protein